MEKRKIILGDYDTALHGHWTLASWSFPEPEYQANLVTVPGRDGPLDLSAALTGGVPRYNGRTLIAVLECSEGTRADRLRLAADMVNKLHGRRMQITLPDDPTRYVEGRVDIRTNYNDLAHASVTVTAVCDPWRQSKRAKTVSLDMGVDRDVVHTSTLTNSGHRPVSPLVEVHGIPGEDVLKLTANGHTWELAPGTYTLPDLVLAPGVTAITYRGAKGLMFTYREAVL